MSRRTTDPLLRHRLGMILRGLRERVGLSQASLAYQIGVSRAYLTEVEAGRYSFSPETLRIAARVLGTDPNTLLGWEEDK